MKEKTMDSEVVLLRPDEIDKKVLKELKKAGIKNIELDVLSTNDYILGRCKRKYTYQDIKKVSRLVRFHRFNFECKIAVGLLESTRLDEMNTAREIAKLKPKKIRIVPVLVTKGSNIEEEYLKEEYEPLELGQAVEICKELKQFFEKKKIKNVCIENDDTNKIIAGPYHEHIGELVDSEYYYDIINEEIKKINTKAKEIKITVNPEIASSVIGFERENIEKIKENYNLDVKIEQNWKYSLKKINVEITKTYKEFADDEENV